MVSVYVNETCDYNYYCTYTEYSGAILGVYNIIDQYGYTEDTILLLKNPEGYDPIEFYGMMWQDNDTYMWTPNTLA